MSIKVPPLEPKSRDREYNGYSEALRDKVVYEYLFNGVTHRKLDEIVLGLDSSVSKGWQSMGILHYIGLKDKHKNIFKGGTVEEAIEAIQNQGKENFKLLFSSLSRLANHTTNEVNEANNSNNEIDELVDELVTGQMTFAEGKQKLRQHLVRERNSKVVRLAKQLFKQKHGRLFCEACEFDFESVYGELGKDYIQGHHTKPVSELKEGEETKVSDIVLLCSNCHSMIHNKRPWLSINELKKLLKVRI